MSLIQLRGADVEKFVRPTEKVPWWLGLPEILKSSRYTQPDASIRPSNGL